MPRQIALLRGVNVGGARKLPMAQLRELFESLGYRDVVTLIQSGNVVFTASSAASEKKLAAAIADRFSLDVDVMVRTPQQLKKIIAANPFPKAEPGTVHVGFMAAKAPAAVVNALDAERFLPDEFAVRATELYVHLPKGLGTSKLLPYLARQLKVPTTVRNWNTVNKLLTLC